jgi:hypothetical protein
MARLREYYRWFLPFYVSYIRNPIQFIFKKILRIHEVEEVEKYRFEYVGNHYSQKP